MNSGCYNFHERLIDGCRTAARFHNIGHGIGSGAPALGRVDAEAPRVERASPSASDRGADRHAGVARIAEAAKATGRAPGAARCADAAREQTFRRAGAALGGHAIAATPIGAADSDTWTRWDSVVTKI